MRKIKNVELGRISAEEFKEADKLPCVVVMDEVRSAMNVGSAFRTGDAFRIDRIHLCGITAKPPHKEINKTALGSQDTVKWVAEETTLSCVSKLKEEGYTIIAVEQADQSTSLLDFDVSKEEKYAFVFGNEVFGVADEVIAASDTVLEIPQYGTKHSLNISVSIGVVLWHFVSKQKTSQNRRLS